MLKIIDFFTGQDCFSISVLQLQSLKQQVLWIKGKMIIAADDDYHDDDGQNKETGALRWPQKCKNPLDRCHKSALGMNRCLKTDPSR